MRRVIALGIALGLMWAGVAAAAKPDRDTRSQIREARVVTAELLEAESDAYRLTSASGPIRGCQRRGKWVCPLTFTWESDTQSGTFQAEIRASRRSWTVGNFTGARPGWCLIHWPAWMCGVA